MLRKTGVKRASGAAKWVREALAHFGNAQMWKTKGIPPCAVGGFMSNIKMFPMALLPGWPFAPNKTPGAKTV